MTTVEEIVEKGEKQLEELQDEEKQIKDKVENLEQEKRNLEEEEHTVADEVNSRLENEITGMKEIKKKIDELHRAKKELEQLNSDLWQLYNKAFKNIVRKRVVIPKDVSEFSRYRRVTLYPKGIGSALEKYDGKVGSSSKVSDIDMIKKALETEGIVDYIKKPSKKRIFKAFSENICNWMEKPPTDIKINKDCEYIEIDKKWRGGTNIKRRTIHGIQFTDRKYGKNMDILFQRETTNPVGDAYTETVEMKKLENIEGNHYYTLSQVWDEIKININKKINEVEAVVENNRVVLENIRRKISKDVVAEQI